LGSVSHTVLFQNQNRSEYSPRYYQRSSYGSNGNQTIPRNDGGAGLVRVSVCCCFS
jgi:hypothetical protein